jgi:hypothetical protein
MSLARLHSLTAIYLAVLYGAVGITGESLHYLVADPAAFLPSSPSAVVVVYYHTHGPDHHGHFHRHFQRVDDSHVAATSHGFDGREKSAVISPEQVTHEDHACPLLSLVSRIKIGGVAYGATTVTFNTLITPNFERGSVAEFEAEFSSSARGPPDSSLA